MKSFLALAFLATSLTSLAASVKVTSFNYVRIGNTPGYSPLAELCGVVEGATSSPSYVKAIIDPKTNNPGTYNTVVGEDGKFCLAVITFRGTADVSVFGDKNKTTTQIK